MKRLKTKPHKVHVLGLGQEWYWVCTTCGFRETNLGEVAAPLAALAHKMKFESLGV